MKITIYAICKNEEKFIDRWFNSIKDADYIRVLDTGSTDNTITLLQKLKESYPNKFDYSCQEIKPWRFDTARNMAMQLVPSDSEVLVSADLDDVFIPNWRNIVERNIEKGYNKIFGHYPYYNDAGEIVSQTLQDRVCLNNGSYWEGAIHERLITPNENSTLDDEWIIEHRQDEGKDRRENYLAAAKNGAQDGGFYARLCLGYELYNSGYMEESLNTFKELHNDLPQDSEFLTRKMLVFMGQLCRELGDSASAALYYKQAKTIYKQDSPFEDYFLYEENYINNLISQLHPNKICVYAITKNESKFVEKWYESMKEADSIVVLDTGSTDDTVEKLRALGVRVEQKTYNPWRFDTPRNDAMELAPADCNILLSTDLDEVLEPGWAEHLRNNWVEGIHTRALYRYVWSHTDTGAEGRVFGYNKAHSRDWVWRYPVHELLWNPKTNSETYPEEEQLNLFNLMTLHHYPDMTKSRSSYLGLLELREKENPEDLYGLIYLAHEYHYQGMFDKSIEKLNKTLTNYPNIDATERASCYLFMGDDYIELRDNEKAIECYDKGIEVEDTFRELYLNKAKALMNLNRHKDAVKTILLGLEKSYRHYSWLERDLSWSYEPYDLLCLAYYYGGNKYNSLINAKIALSYDENNPRLRDNVQLIENEIENDKLKPRAYVSVLSNNSFINGIVMLKQSLNNVNSQYPLYCIVGSEVSQENRKVLEQIGVSIINRNPDYFEKNKKQQIQIIETLDVYGWHKAMLKLEIFNLTEFNKIVYLDADMLVLQNIDHLFDLPHMSAAKDMCDHSGCRGNGSFNSGLLVVEPNIYEYQKILQHLTTFNSEQELIHDQLVLQSYFNDWKEQLINLSPDYNYWTSYFNENSEEYFFNNIKILHFIDKKPWHVNKEYFNSCKTDYYQYAQVNLWYIDYLNYTIKKLRNQGIYSSDLKFID